MGVLKTGLFKRGLTVVSLTRSSRIHRTAALGLSIMLAPLMLAAQQFVSTEYRAKAFALVNFSKFVEWPKSAFPTPDSPFLLCLIGENDFGVTLAQMMQSASSHGRKISVRMVGRREKLPACQMLFVSHSERSRYEQVLDIAREGNVLTVGETPEFVSAGGMVSLTVQEPRVKFEVNLVAAEGAGLKISSKLLALAQRVTTVADKRKP